MYTTEELRAKGHIISSVDDFLSGKIVRMVGQTVNYYSQKQDGTWDNTHCRTVG